MKPTLLLIALFLSFTALAQTPQRFPSVDKSPLDVSYYPSNYPIMKVQPGKVLEPLIARVIYSRPQKNGRNVFEELVENGKVWRLGANEATEVEFFREVRIGAKKIKKGRYTLYAIENDSTWTLILNTELDVWGAFKYNVQKDVVRVECPVLLTQEITETLTMVFEKNAEKAIQLVIAWDDRIVSLPISW
ncbi:MAG: DUF2911 domain-containing protein [Bacteroidetes bacterium]|nr:DUF2911 domain-containing protein [Bacteroidota bacterium]